ncbi:MAG: peptidylprolyl isomerase [Bacilli bacterium]|nr:peptidylprolyl isomerase [Bacilli bacterium]
MKKGLLLVACVFLLAGCGHVSLTSGENAAVTFKDGGISSDTLYKELKEMYGAEKVMNMIDKALLEKKYETGSDERKYISQSIKSAKEQAEEMGADLNLFLNYYYGVADEEAYKEYLSLNYKRQKWIDEYAKTTVTQKQIEEYYETKVFGDVEASQILITVDVKEDATEEDKKTAEANAKKQAEDIIKKLKDGADFATLAKEYSKDAATAANGGSLGKINDGDAPSEVLDALRNLKNGSYSTTPVKSSYGYHVVYKTSQDKKPELNDETKNSVIEKVGAEIAAESSFYFVALEALREQNGLKFQDKELEKDYNDLMTQYKNQYNTTN